MFYAGEEAQAVAQPLDALIDTVLEFYQSRYAVLAYEASQPTATTTPETPSPFDTRYAPPQTSRSCSSVERSLVAHRAA